VLIGGFLGRHRREVLGALARSTADCGIAVVGTCRESVWDGAADCLGALLRLACPGHTEALDAPARMVGYGVGGGRVESTAEALRAGRAWW
jgi:hypothetical protein